MITFLCSWLSSYSDCSDIAYSERHYTNIRLFASIPVTELHRYYSLSWLLVVNFLSNEITITDLKDFGLIAYKASRGNSLILFLSQRLDLLVWFYVYPLGFSLLGNLTHHLALYQVSIRTLERIATPLPSLMASLPTACGLLHLAVKTCGQFISDWISAMPGTPKKDAYPKDKHLIDPK